MWSDVSIFIEAQMGRLKPKRNTSTLLAVHIGKQLLAARQSTNVTMQTVSEHTGLSKSFISQIENGQSVPSADTLWKLAKYFEVNISYFFDGYLE